MTTTITATTTVIGLHHWPDAPERRAYLRYPHRHRFGIAVTVDVAHSDREVEWHDLADEVFREALTFGRQYHPDTLLTDFGPMSCESLAGELAASLSGPGFSYKVISVRVDEDGEHTAEVTP